MLIVYDTENSRYCIAREIQSPVCPPCGKRSRIRLQELPGDLFAVSPGDSMFLPFRANRWTNMRQQQIWRQLQSRTNILTYFFPFHIELSENNSLKNPIYVRSGLVTNKNCFTRQKNLHFILCLFHKNKQNVLDIRVIISFQSGYGISCHRIQHSSFQLVSTHPPLPWISSTDI